MTNIINLEGLLAKNNRHDLITELDRLKDIIYTIDYKSLEMLQLTRDIWFKLCQIGNDIRSNDSLETVEAKIMELKQYMLSQKCN